VALHPRPIDQRSDAATGQPDESAAPLAWRRWYLSVTAKFAVALAFTGAWIGLSIWLSLPWLRELDNVAGPLVAVVVVVLVAWLPGGLVAFMAASLLLDRQPPLRAQAPVAALTVLVAARNEASGIGDTICRLANTSYAGAVQVIIADNGSVDSTVELARAAAVSTGSDLLVVSESKPGKSNALNAALRWVDTDLVVTVDADTMLHPEALSRLVGRLESAPPDTVAVAGSVLVRNSRKNWLTRLQEWDYFLGISGVKRKQGMYQSTLVAQGAFSLYRTQAVRDVGGWPDAIGEDIVLTWRLMHAGERVLFEPTAVAFTDVPEHLAQFCRQRSRWARGMLEGLRDVPPWRQPRRLSRLVAGIDLLIPLLDIGYTLVWLPGLILFCCGIPLIVSVWTLVVLPFTFAVYSMIHVWQVRRVFRPLGLRVRHNRLGFIAYLIIFQAIASPTAIYGYGQYAFGTRRRWK
jgi:poly-beta-1,6-N-acetyl-D-glucosamine synthase